MNLPQHLTVFLPPSNACATLLALVALAAIASGCGGAARTPVADPLTVRALADEEAGVVGPVTARTVLG